MTPLIATKSMRYATRHLEAGDAFDAVTERDARTLTAIRKARYLSPDEVAAREKAAGKAEAKQVKTAEPVKTETVSKVSPPPAPVQDEKKSDELTADELLEIMDDLPFLTFKSKATAILGDKTPSTKADIIAALESHAKNA